MVGHNTALRTSINVKQRSEDEISAYIRMFDLMCT